jgi:hypothetical protein
MEVPKRQKRDEVHLDTLDTDLLGVQVERVEKTDELEEELRALAECYRPTRSRVQRKELWESHLRARDPENNVSVIDDRAQQRTTEQPEEQDTAAPLPLSKAFETWLCDSSVEELLARDSLAFLDAADAGSLQTLRIKLSARLARPLQLPAVNQLLAQNGFRPAPQSLLIPHGELRVYASEQRHLVLFTHDGRLKNYWAV